MPRILSGTWRNIAYSARAGKRGAFDRSMQHHLRTDLVKGVCMIQQKRSRLSTTEKTDVWRRWKAGQSLHAIGRAYGKWHNSIQSVLRPRGGIPESGPGNFESVDVLLAYDAEPRAPDRKDFVSPVLENRVSTFCSSTRLRLRCHVLPRTSARKKILKLIIALVTAKLPKVFALS
jgi:hypothetical protein